MINLLDVRIRRILAFGADIIIIFILGFIIGNLLKNQLIGLGHNAQIIGLSIASLYHGLANSLLLRGQTVGKILFRIQLISKDGHRVNPVLSIIRSLSVLVGFFLSEPSIFPESLHKYALNIISAFTVGLIWFLFISPGSRSLHDYLFGTYVVDSDTQEFEVCQLTWRKTLGPIILSILLFVLSEVYSIMDSSVDPGFVSRFEKASSQLEAIPNVRYSGIKIENNEYYVTIQTTKPPVDSVRISILSANVLIKNLELNDSSQQITTTIMYGYEMKIFNSWHYYSMTHSVRDWEKRGI